MITEEKIPKIEEEVNGFIKKSRLSLLKQGKPVYVTANGMSMYPFLKSVDRLKIVAVKEAELKLGDIIVVDRKSRDAWFTVHRLVKISEDKSRYFTKGDFHKEGMDRPITIEDIAGKVVWLRRKNLEINLEKGAWNHINRIIAKLSLSFPRALVYLSSYISLVIEWKLFLAKANNRLKKGNPVFYNAEELILICARKDLNEPLRDRAVDLIKEGINWEIFCDYAVKGGLTVLVYGSLKNISCYVCIPGHVIEKLRSTSIYIIRKSVFQERRLAEILKLFAAQDIPVIPLKGMILAKRLYGDIAARGLNVDFDFLIKESDKTKSLRLLKEIKYILMPDGGPSRYECQYFFVKPKETIIDLHLDITLTVRSRERITGLWEGARNVTDGRVSYYEFEEEELLLHLCAHLVYSDCCRNLKYLSDINQLLNNNSLMMDWDSIVKKAKQWRLSSSLYTALSMCGKLFDYPVEKDVLDKIKPALAKRAFIGIFANKKFILRDCKRKKIMDLCLSYVFFELVEAESFLEYFNIIFRRILFPPRDVLLSNKSYSSRPVFAGYILRLFQGFTSLISIVK
jgi:hypothetical protein